MVVIVAVAGALAGVAVASAHAEPVRAKPGDGALLPQGPTEIVLEMSQDMVRQAGVNAIELYDSGGNAIATEPAEVDASNRRVLRLRLEGGTLPAGEYTVRWRTLSADDGDTAEGTLRFRVDPGATPDPGREVLKESLLGGTTPVVPTAPPALQFGTNEGNPLVLAAALGVGLLVIGVGLGVVLGRKAG